MGKGLISSGFPPLPRGGFIFGVCMQDLAIVYKDIDSLIPYANNSRTHSDEQITQIASSIKEFGFTNPILIDEQGGIIAGHGRVLAAQQLNMLQVPTIALAGLTKAQKKAYIIADNKLALNAGWDYDLLRIEFNQLDELNFDLSLTGFNVAELEELLNIDGQLKELEEQSSSGEIDVDDFEMDCKCPKCGFEFNAK